VSSVKVLNKNKIDAVLNRLAEVSEVFVPMQRGPQSGFFAWKSFDDKTDKLALDVLNVYLPPKNVVLPQTEKMYSFQQEGVEVKIDQVYEDPNPKIIFGVRGCDAQGIACLDQAFLTRGYEDGFYKARRDATTIIANACYTPGPNCFCTSMGGNPAEVPTADVLLRDAGEQGYVWESQTAKGQAVTEKIADLLEEKQASLPSAQPITRQVNYEGVAEKLKGMFEHPMWAKNAEPCQTCGICTYSCPTCYCFDIQVKNWGEEGYRFRCYDSCMYREYSLMAGGHNPREAAVERFRNRFLHKLQFFNERYGTPLCTGCGRCIIVCPAGVSIVKIINEIKEAE